MVRPAGTIRVVRGRYVTEDVLIDKPLTIVGIGIPEIVNEVGTTSLLIAGLGEGTVVIEGLAFRNEAPPSGAGFFEQSSSIALENGFDDLIVQENSFSGLPGNGLHIFQRTRTEVLTPSVTLRDNEFRTGRRALRISNRGRPTVSVSITGNLVSDFSDRGMHLFGVTGLVGDNDMSLCGSWCVRARGSGGLDVSDNRMHDCAANGTNGTHSVAWKNPFIAWSHSDSTKFPIKPPTAKKTTHWLHSASPPGTVRFTTSRNPRPA